MLIEDRIKEWREDEDVGMAGAVELICEAEEEIRRLRAGIKSTDARNISSAADDR